jgi:hypothetical protein
MEEIEISFEYIVEHCETIADLIKLEQEANEF